LSDHTTTTTTTTARLLARERLLIGSNCSVFIASFRIIVFKFIFQIVVMAQPEAVSQSASHTISNMATKLATINTTAVMQADTGGAGQR
jgi:hypothetical protein